MAMSLSIEEKVKLIQLLNRRGQLIVLDLENGSLWNVTNLSLKKFDFFKLCMFLRSESFEDSSVDWDGIYEKFHGRRVGMEITRTGKSDITIGRKGCKIYFIHIDLLRDPN